MAQEKAAQDPGCHLGEPGGAAHADEAMARRLGLCDECIGPIGVNPIRVRKSFGSDTAFSEDLVGSSKIESGVLAMADEV